MNSKTSFDLKGRVAIVTGASRGIGRAIAIGLAREGVSVVVNYVSKGAAAEEVVSEIRAAGGEAVAVQADVGDLAQHERLVGAAHERFGRIDILVNNAAMTRREPFLDATAKAWDETMDVNLKGIYFLSQAVARVMAAQKSGKIINISSVHDVRAMVNNSIYNISKAGLVMLTKSLALELAEKGIQVNCVSPGAILTDDTRPRLADPAYRDKVLAKIPSRRVGEPEDVVGAVLLLASPASDYITGTTLYVDGGMLL
ncbi:MAG: glucose 1-dehydrogenase [Verrucomicrobia bacterium]|nr:glucose 1-dehydrogenase [Verrucomicrobiota bacterium]